jgi:RHS repeat-associated protein
MRNNRTRPFNLVSTILALGLLTIGSVHAAEVITYYHLDALGSPVAATDEAGNLKWREDYKPYGEKIRNEPAASSNSRAYTGHPHDNDTGLTYAGARYYDPIIGRFMAIDPKGFGEGNLQSFNRYGYANNNPYKYIDPDGMAPGDPFGSQDEAAADFGKTYNDDSIRRNREYGSAIYKYQDAGGNSSYSYNVPQVGSESGTKINWSVEPGQKAVSTVHSHSDYNPDIDNSLLPGGMDGNNHPSLGDRLSAGRNSEYVTTPNGSLIKYNYNDSNDVVIRTDMPSSPRDPGRVNQVSPYKNRVDDPFKN